MKTPRENNESNEHIIALIHTLHQPTAAGETKKARQREIPPMAISHNISTCDMQDLNCIGHEIWLIVSLDIK